MVQKHDASRLHYDFRLEAGGVLKSWAVPKGPSLDPAHKRLAVRTEDHPLDYADFEGLIPEGQYGGGTVMVWDRGTYHNLSSEKGRPIAVERAVEKGHVKVWLQGSKLEGAWSLVRTSRGEPGKEQWLLIKADDPGADRTTDITESHPRSVVTERTIEEIAAAPESRVWQSNR